ncbi:MAG: sarcosine oxidase subunit gamma family protein [Rhodospirillales bacterium]|jgi:sarcosine oxidase subunit gamma|nr:sarcosine oxidase subunit gamma family protein [Rhodospirillales bacterium]MDP6773393.1 sarcosine oxidase subunit gamma family protein [Rhodospirillales bacterium]
MADAYLRQSPLAHLGLAARAAIPPEDIEGTEAGVVLCERPARHQIGLRGDARRPAFRAAVKGVLGFAPPAKATTAAGGTGLPRALWLGPDEWLVVTDDDDAATVADLSEALARQHAHVVDLSDARAVIGLAGAGARDVLMKGCTLDVHRRAFGPGRCTRTLLARAQVIVHQITQAPDYDLYVQRSFAEYLWAWLEDAGTEYGVRVTA